MLLFIASIIYRCERVKISRIGCMFPSSTSHFLILVGCISPAMPLWLTSSGVSIDILTSRSVGAQWRIMNVVSFLLLDTICIHGFSVRMAIESVIFLSSYISFRNLAHWRKEILHKTASNDTPGRPSGSTPHPRLTYRSELDHSTYTGHIGPCVVAS